MPPANDDIVNATVVTVPGDNLSLTTVDSTGEAQELGQGYDDTGVWVRIEVADDGKLILSTSGANYPYYIEIYLPTDTTPVNFSDVTDGFTYNSFVDSLDDNGGTVDDFLELDVLAGEVYYLRVGDWDFDGSEGSIGLFVGLSIVCDAADGANLSSATVSIVDTDWVREEQFRTLTPDVLYDGNMDFTETFEVDTTVCGIPTGEYKVEIFRRYDAKVPGGYALVQMRKNGKPLAQSWAGFNATVGVEQWVNVTRLDWTVGTFTATNGFGPHYVKLNAGDVLSFDCGDNFIDGDNVLEIQRVRFTPVLASPPVPSWRKALSGAETWRAGNSIPLSPFLSLGNVIYGFMEIHAEGVGDPRLYLGVWTWELNGSDITPLSGETPIGFGGSMGDLATGTPRIGGSGTCEVMAHDFCVLPNGDIVAAWVERDGSPLLHYIVVAQYDAGGDSWSILTTDLWGHGASLRTAVFVSVDATADGNDVYIAWSESRQTTAPRGYWIRCKHLDPGSGTFTEIGTTSSAGLTHFPGAAATVTNAGEPNGHLRLRVSPAGVPWITWPELDGDNLFDNVYPVAYFYDGANWVDSELPFPSVNVPPTDYLGVTTDYSSALSSGNYVAFATATQQWYMDLTFCTHAGPSEDPLICFQWVWKDIDATAPNADVSGWSLFDYGGSPGSWGNERFLLEGIDYGDGTQIGQVFGNIERGGIFALAGGWTQGFNLTNDGSRPWLFTQKGYGSTSADHPYAAKLSADGSTFELPCYGFPDDETYPYTNPSENDAGGGGWTDPTTNGGCLVNGTPIVVYRDVDSFSGGLVLVAGTGCGGIVSMNWRSSDRRGAANRVLVGDR